MCRRFLLLVSLGLGLVLSAACAEEVTRPVGTVRSDIVLWPDTRTIEDRVPRNATLAGLLGAHDVSTDLVARLIDAARPVFDPRRLRIGHPYRLVVSLEGLLRRFEYHIDNDKFLRVVTHDDQHPLQFQAELVPYVKERAELASHGEIDRRRSSLVAALEHAGEQVQLAIEMAEIFGGEIDFNNDLRQGDHFDVLFEKYSREDEFVGYGNVIAAEFVNDGRRIRAFAFTPPGGEPAYYDEEGRSLKRLFLRSPFKFEPRVTSGFSYRRLHPVLGMHRAHLGVDYGAPRGTPVIAVASGLVEFAGRSGGSGNMVRVRHTNGYETYYLHLSLFAEGIRRGARVSQGQMIGRVGATGLATGPHLDFRMRKNGAFVNPLLEHRKLPPGDPVPAGYLEAFRQARDHALGRLLSASEPIAAPGSVPAQ